MVAEYKISIMWTGFVRSWWVGGKRGCHRWVQEVRPDFKRLVCGSISNNLEVWIWGIFFFFKKEQETKEQNTKELEKKDSEWETSPDVADYQGPKVTLNIFILAEHC
jgi:hypothetical protein